MKRLIAVIQSAVMMLSGCGIEYASLPTESTEATAAVVDIDRERAEEILSSMTTEEKICQMMFVTMESITGVSPVTVAGEATGAALSVYPVGGVIYFAGNIVNPKQVKDMISAAQSYSKIPLFIGVDEEGGRVARISGKSAMGFDKIKPMKQVGGKDEAYQIGRRLGENLAGLLFNLDFAPVADVIVDGKNSEIGDRSFGSDPLWVGDMVSEVVKGLEETGVSSVLKHFPGHGSTTANSHNGYSQSTRTMEELRQCELVPFKRGIEAGCDFVMISHMTLVNAIDEKVPASLSKEVVTNLLKGEMGFEGIAITDSLSMGAITKEYTAGEAAVKAVKAGCDMLLMPKSVEEAKKALTDAVMSGEITEDRIDESVRKILITKIEKGLM